VTIIHGPGLANWEVLGCRCLPTGSLAAQVGVRMTNNLDILGRGSTETVYFKVKGETLRPILEMAKDFGMNPSLMTGLIMAGHMRNLMAAGKKAIVRKILRICQDGDESIDKLYSLAGHGNKLAAEELLYLTRRGYQRLNILAREQTNIISVIAANQEDWPILYPRTGKIRIPDINLGTNLDTDIHPKMDEKSLFTKAAFRVLHLVRTLSEARPFRRGLKKNTEEYLFAETIDNLPAISKSTLGKWWNPVIKRLVDIQYEKYKNAQSLQNLKNLKSAYSKPAKMKNYFETQVRRKMASLLK
jgi:hypothetical protein